MADNVGGEHHQVLLPFSILISHLRSNPFHQQVSPGDERIVSSSSSSVAPPDPYSYYNVLQSPTNLYHPPYDWDAVHSGKIRSPMYRNFK